tara:strand:- start:400 stop:1173 length:774 start_codon:yes stop_codon:yes gene_type:complete
MKNKKCKNCNHSIDGEFCSKCGQKDIELLKFKDLIKEFLNHLLDLDSRLFITLKYLIAKPGFLTTEYWRGRRVRYIPPFKIYLLSSFLYFFIYSILPKTDIVNSQINDPDFGRKKLATKVSINLDEVPEIWDYYMDKYEKEIELLFLLPLTACGLFILNKKNSNLFYTHHFIASIHLSAAWFLLQTIIEILIVVLPNHTFYIELLNIILLIYCSTFIKNVYNTSYLQSIIKTIALIIVIFISMLLFFVIASIFILVT